VCISVKSDQISTWESGRPYLIKLLQPSCIKCQFSDWIGCKDPASPQLAIKAHQR